MAKTPNVLTMTPMAVRDLMLSLGLRRAYVVWDRNLHRPRASHPIFDAVAESFAEDQIDYKQHEGVFLEVGAVTNYLMGAFILKTKRGAAAGGVRLWNYDTFEQYLHDGIRLAVGMGRKNALAGLWWGGGKGVIAALDQAQVASRPFRDRLFSEYGNLISGIHGCYVTAEDLGVRTVDCDRMFTSTRWTTCISPALGGSGNPGIKTGYGIVTGMEAALAHLGRGGSVAGKSVAVMGCGNVCNAMVERLLERGVGRVVAADVNPRVVAEFLRRWAGRQVTARVASPGDFSILYEDVDVVSPCAVGGVINARTIPNIRARIVCGSANNQLADDKTDDKLLRQRGIRFVVDFIANRMGIVNAANEQYGCLENDPAIERHFSREYEHGIFQVVRRVLGEADRRGCTEVEAANALADEAMDQMHPIFPHRGQTIIDELVRTHWESQAPLSAKL